MEGAGLTVFISHVHEDESLAVCLKEFLEGIFLNANVFVSGRDLAGGRIWFEELRQKLEGATAIVALATPFSLSSPWVHFEAGAGFVGRRTVPLLADGVTHETLRPPFRLLQARSYDEAGLKDLVKDIATLANLRQPIKFPGLDEILHSAREFLKLRNAAADASEDAAEETEIGAPAVDQRPDPALKRKADELAERARVLVIRDIERHRAAFDVPTPAEMRTMRLMDLWGIAKAVGASVPVTLQVLLPYHDMAIPRIDAPPWEKINEEKQFKDIEQELRNYERRLG